jgi:hypothetical protein
MNFHHIKLAVYNLRMCLTCTSSRSVRSLPLRITMMVLVSEHKVVRASLKPGSNCNFISLIWSGPLRLGGSTCAVIVPLKPFNHTIPRPDACGGESFVSQKYCWIFLKTMDDRWPKIDTICWTVWKRSILHVQKPSDWPSSITLQKIHSTF